MHTYQQKDPDDDVITALATGTGGALNVIRLSGRGCLDVARQVWRGKKFWRVPRTLCLGRVISIPEGTLIDRGLAVFFKGPHSYTGEDVVEFHLHGGGAVARQCLQALLAAGARFAEAGEFTRRAFLNGKLDLTQAEAVNDVIRAHSELALRLAQRQLDGALGKVLRRLYDELTMLRADCEAHLDFPDEDLDLPPVSEMEASVSRIIDQVNRLLQTGRMGEMVRQGVRVAIVGPPNAGKSSLLNCILGQDRAIVTHFPGTTRDTLEALAHIGQIPVCLVDTAGIRETDNPIEQEGIRRSFRTIA
ncbi:MAG: tRNA uridine-5-carboxymethylaminomethyl(34) synthesis GTPase MnmE, partial [Lentisphaerae bacterium]